MRNDKRKGNNETPVITLEGENGEAIDFLLAAEVELDDYSYVILKPVDNTMGLDPDEAIIFRLEADGILEPEYDDDIIDRISDIYNNDLEG